MASPEWKLPNAVLDYRIELARGNIPGAASFGKAADRENISLGDTVDIWCPTISPRVDLTSPERMTVVSTDVADQPTLGGAINLLIFGVDGDWEEMFEVVELDGLTPVTTINSYLRVNFCIVAQAGAADINVGDLIIAGELGLDIQDVVKATHGYSCSTHYAVPKGRRIVIPNITAAVRKNNEVRVHLLTKTGSQAQYIKAFSMYLESGTVTIPDQSFSFAEMSDIKFQATALTNGCNVDLFYPIYQFVA